AGRDRGEAGDRAPQVRGDLGGRDAVAELDPLETLGAYALLERITTRTLGEEQQAGVGMILPHSCERLDEHARPLPFGHGPGVDEVRALLPAVLPVVAERRGVDAVADHGRSEEHT